MVGRKSTAHPGPYTAGCGGQRVEVESPLATQCTDLERAGRKSGVSYASIWRIENGHNDVRTSTIRKLAYVLGVDAADDLVVEDGGEHA